MNSSIRKILLTRLLPSLLWVLTTVNALGAEIELKEVEFTTWDQTFYGSLVLPTGTHRLNQLAKKADQELDHLRMIYSSELLTAAGGKGAYSIKEHILFLPESALSSETLGPVVLHELIHATLWTELRRAKPALLNGVAYNDRAEFQNRQYGPFFGIDEVATTLFSVRYHARAMRASLAIALANPSSLTAFADPIESMHQVRVYLARLQTMLRTLHLGIGEATENTEITTPEELAFVPASVSWQETASNQIRILTPTTTSNAALKMISKYAKDAAPAIEEADSAGAKLQIMTSETAKKRHEQANKFLDKTDSVIDAFTKTFKQETTIMNAVEATY